MKNSIVSVAPGGRISIVKLGAGEVAIPIVSEAWGGDDFHGQRSFVFVWRDDFHGHDMNTYVNIYIYICVFIYI